MQFKRTNQFLRATYGNFRIELFSSESFKNTIIINIEVFDENGIFQNSLEKKAEFSTLDAAFMIAHGTTEDLLMILHRCQQLALGAIHTRSSIGHKSDATLTGLKETLSLPWGIGI
ncbi:hypothetical protein [Chromobacterium sphagni]|uniref:hypothetical protein n=1 Tax=Chromobacterium sphagni TaxID=1903179 RepID=UPI001114667A|nr:hypothetical protein [Chromobacterium sphagni]